MRECTDSSGDRVSSPFVEVAVDAWFADRRTTLTYGVPAYLDRALDVGQLIWAPLRKRLVLGIVVERHDRPPRTGGVRDLHALVEPAFCLSPMQWRLATWIAEQTLSTLFEAASLMLPPGVSHRAVEHLALSDGFDDAGHPQLTPLQRRLVDLLDREGELPLERAQRLLGSSLAAVVRDLERTGRITRIARVQHRPSATERQSLQIRLLPDASPPPARATRQVQAYAWLSARLRARPNQTLPMETVLNAASGLVDRRSLQALADRGTIAIEPLMAHANGAHTHARDVVLTLEQQHAWQSIRASMRDASPARILVHGVTGSGKTELYLRIAADVLASGRSVVMLAPEIALSSQIAARFRERFADLAVVLHSALNDSERARNWERARSGEPLVVVGPRSALFAPLPTIGAIIVDEEHEPAYKQDAAPRYHARTVAEQIALLHRATLILGSATPDVETFHASRGPGWQRVTLRERVGQRVIDSSGELLAAPIPLPRTRIVDMRAELRSGNPSIFSRALINMIDDRLDAGQQVILFLNRRGTSTLVQCRVCGNVSSCPYCDIPMVYHRVGERMVCHRCGHRTAPPVRCSTCGTEGVSYYGVGAQRVESEVSSRFPRARILRWDQDALRRGVRHEDLLRRVAEREVDILVGTQMIAKGLDLPGIGAVGVVNADTFLHLPDIRAAERTFQMLTQVAGRAARRTAGGEVLIQTYSAEHYAISCAARHDYLAFYREEIAFRRRHGYPPFKRLTRLVYRHQDEIEARLEAERIAAVFTESAESSIAPADVDLIGPAPAFVARYRGRYGWQILLRGSDALRLLDGISLGRGWTVDVDPMSLL